MSRIKIILSFICLYLTFVYGTESGDGFEPSKITSELKAKFLKHPIPEGFDIIIEFGGNSKPIKEFKEIQRKLEKERSVPLPKGEKISLLVSQLEEHAASSQLDVIDLLKSKNVEHFVIRVSNEIFVRKAGPELISEIAEKFGKVVQIRSVIKLNPPRPVEVMETPAAGLKEGGDGLGWSVYQVNARCKEIGCLGDGAVVAIIDTGVLRSHVELRDNYREEYGWFDPVDGTLEANFNVEAGFHGTHCAGIAVGKTKGIAPNAKWIACRCFRGDPSEEFYHKMCGEWALCPWKGTDLSTRNCSMAPDVTSNSYGFVPSEQLTFQRRFFYSIVAAWNAAGILHAISAGNYGPYCTTVGPPAMYDVSFSVAAVDNTSTATYWSSRGPALDMELDTGDSLHIGTCKNNCAGNGWGWNSDGEVCTLTKPDISAPGYQINSSYTDSDTSYAVFSGTSMAAPAVAGILALMVCGNKQVEAPPLDQMTATRFIKETAITHRINLAEGHENSLGNRHGRPNNFARISNILCNKGYGNTCNSFPNNIYGYGEIDACAAVKKVKFLL